MRGVIAREHGRPLIAPSAFRSQLYRSQRLHPLPAAFRGVRTPVHALHASAVVNRALHNPAAGVATSSPLKRKGRPVTGAVWQ